MSDDDADVAVGSTENEILHFDNGTSSTYTGASFNDGMGAAGEANEYVGFNFEGTDYGSEDSSPSDNIGYTAFANDGDDFGTGISDGDVFIGGKGYDTAVLDKSFQEYEFDDATSDQITAYIDLNGLGQVVTVKGLSDSAESQLGDALVEIMDLSGV